MPIHRPTRRQVLAAGGAVLGSGFAGCTGLVSQSGAAEAGTGADGGETGDGLTVFHAGSLAPAFEEIAADFEAQTRTPIARESSGSVVATKKVTEQGRAADVLAVADFRLLRDRLLPEFGDWYAVFATNAMAIQYREGAPGADDIGPDNWWETLAREDVTVGHADPATDPGGYRAVMVLQLGAQSLDGQRLYDETTARSLRENAVVSTGSEINLEWQLETGKLDYALTYRSLCETSDLPSLALQPHVDLSRLSERYARHYASAAVETSAGRFTGAPIAYGVTVPSVARNPAGGARLVEFLASEQGQERLDDAGFSPVSPVVVPAAMQDAVPERIADSARPADSLGPLVLQNGEN